MGCVPRYARGAVRGWPSRFKLPCVIHSRRRYRRCRRRRRATAVAAAAAAAAAATATRGCGHECAFLPATKRHPSHQSDLSCKARALPCAARAAHLGPARHHCKVPVPPDTACRASAGSAVHAATSLHGSNSACGLVLPGGMTRTCGWLADSVRTGDGHAAASPALLGSLAGSCSTRAGGTRRPQWQRASGTLHGPQDVRVVGPSGCPCRCRCCLPRRWRQHCLRPRDVPSVVSNATPTPIALHPTKTRTTPKWMTIAMAATAAGPRARASALQRSRRAAVTTTGCQQCSAPALRAW